MGMAKQTMDLRPLKQQSIELDVLLTNLRRQHNEIHTAADRASAMDAFNHTKRLIQIAKDLADQLQPLAYAQLHGKGRSTT